MISRVKNLMFFFVFSVFVFVVFDFKYAAAVADRPEINVSNLVASSGKISGQVAFKNLTNGIVNNVTYSIILKESDIEVKGSVEDGVSMKTLSPGSIVFTQTDKNFFSLLPGEVKNFNFSLNYPETIISGKYKLEVRLVLVSGRILTGRISDLSLSGSGEFLKILRETCRLFIGKTGFQPNDGPNIYSGEVPKITCEVINLSNKTLKATPSVSIATLDVSGFPQTDVNKSNLEDIIFAPKEKKIIAFNLTSPQEAQVYQAGIQFHNANGEAISFFQFFRWILKGAAARIDKVSFDKDKYAIGATAKVSVTVWASPDLFWTTYEKTYKNASKVLLDAIKADPERFAGTVLKTPAYKVTVYSEERVCGIGEYKSPEPFDEPIKYQSIIHVKMISACVNPKAEVIFSDGGNSLASLNYQTVSKPKQPKVSVAPSVSWPIWLGIVIALAIVVYLNKRKKMASNI